MKNLLICLLTLTSFSLFSQAHIGVMGAFDLENEYSKLGLGLNYMPIPKEYYPEILFVIFLVVMFSKVYIMVQLANS